MLTMLEIIAILATITAFFSWLNLRTLRMPATVALVLSGLWTSVFVVGLDDIFPGLGVHDLLEQVLRQVSFYDLVMNGLLAFLLFAGAIHADLDQIFKRWKGVASLATIAVFVSAFVVAGGLWLLGRLFSIPLDFGWCLAFGALIAPTDPVAVLAILRSARVPESIRIDLSGETLFNDGIAVVLFLSALTFIRQPDAVTPVSAAELFLLQAGGGLLLGLGAGFVAYRLIEQIDDYVVEIMISLALVTATYALAGRLFVSAPIAVVVAGAFLAERGPGEAMSQRTQSHLSGFWTVVDRTLNSVLFLLIGLEVLVIDFAASLSVIALLAIPLVLFARFLSVAGAVALVYRRQPFPRWAIVILTWGAVRGAIPVALALALPYGPERPLILAATYATVLFSIVVQALTLSRFVALLPERDRRRGPDPDGDP